jgi:hypothetical protein
MIDNLLSSVTISKVSFYDKHRFLLMIGLAITIASIMVGVGVMMYNGSGAAQLDLSRPGYVSVRSKVTNSNNEFQNYSSTGIVNQDSINEFKSLYLQQSQKVKTVDAFGGDPLNPDSLGISSASE